VFELPFYVQKTEATDGAYVYAMSNAAYNELENEDKAELYTNSLTTPENGLIIIKGLASGTYSFTETQAPSGYNKLEDPVSIKATQLTTTTTSTTTYLDEDGNEVDTSDESTHTVNVTIENLAVDAVVVVNREGVELPSTGGMGTTLLYVVGAVLVLGAGVVLVTRRKLGEQK